MKKIFISYAHKDVCNQKDKSLILMIRDDLLSRGHEVWFDKDDIYAGSDWRETIRSGIEGCELMIAFRSENTLSSEVCNKEIELCVQYNPVAVFHVFLDEFAYKKAPNQIHNQYLKLFNPNGDDFESWYSKKFEEILWAVENSRVREFRNEINDLYSKIKVPSDKLDAINNYNEGNVCSEYVGRDWLYSKTVNCNSDLLLITGDPGIGKTSYCNNLTEKHPTKFIKTINLNHNFFNSNTFKDLINKVALEMAIRLESFRKALNNREKEDLAEAYRSEQVSGYFNRLIASPLDGQIDGNIEPITFIVDGIDEIQINERSEFMSNLVLLSKETPPWIKFIATSQPIENVVAFFRSNNAEQITINTQDKLNKKDIENFITTYFKSENVSVLPSVKNKLLDRINGNFMYATAYLQATRDGVLTADELPNGLHDIFLRYFRRQFSSERSFDQVKDILKLVLNSDVSFTPFSISKLLNIKPNEIDERIRALQPLFQIENGVIKPWHGSIIKWLFGETSYEFRFKESECTELLFCSLVKILPHYNRDSRYLGNGFGGEVFTYNNYGGYRLRSIFEELLKKVETQNLIGSELERIWGDYLDQVLCFTKNCIMFEPLDCDCQDSQVCDCYSPVIPPGYEIAQINLSLIIAITCKLVPDNHELSIKIYSFAFSLISEPSSPIAVQNPESVDDHDDGYYQMLLENDYINWLEETTQQIRSVNSSIKGSSDDLAVLCIQLKLDPVLFDREGIISSTAKYYNRIRKADVFEVNDYDFISACELLINLCNVYGDIETGKRVIEHYYDQLVILYGYSSKFTFAALKYRVDALAETERVNFILSYVEEINPKFKASKQYSNFIQTFLPYFFCSTSPIVEETQDYFEQFRDQYMFCHMETEHVSEDDFIDPAIFPEDLEYHSGQYFGNRQVDPRIIELIPLAESSYVYFVGLCVQTRLLENLTESGRLDEAKSVIEILSSELHRKSNQINSEINDALSELVEHQKLPFENLLLERSRFEQLDLSRLISGIREVIFLKIYIARGTSKTDEWEALSIASLYFDALEMLIQAEHLKIKAGFTPEISKWSITPMLVQVQNELVGYMSALNKPINVENAANEDLGSKFKKALSSSCSGCSHINCNIDKNICSSSCIAKEEELEHPELTF